MTSDQKTLSRFSIIAQVVPVYTINRLAYLTRIRNVRRGLRSRTEIIEHLKTDTWISTSEIASQIQLTFYTILYHLRNMERERVVERDIEGRGWRLGPFEQSELMQFLTPPKSKERRKN